MSGERELDCSFIECLLCNRHFTYTYIYNLWEQLRKPLEANE